MARRARGSIDVRRRAGGAVYAVRVEGPPHPLTGRRQQRSQTFADAAEAERRLVLWLAELDAGVDVAPSRESVAAVARRWLEEEAAPSVRGTTLARYRVDVERHIVPRLGSKPAQGLTPSDVSRFRARLLAETSPRTARGAMERLRQILAWAAGVELVRRNVAAVVELPRYAPGEQRPFSHAEARDFLTVAAEDFYSPLWLLLLTTGLRRGEALGLRWRDLDLDDGVLSVRQIVVQCGNALAVQEPKTDASRRAIDLHGRTVAALRAYREERQNRGAGLVFCTAHGRPLHPKGLREHFAALCALVGVEGATIHDLRHTHATHLLLAGVPVAVVSKRLGHSKTSVTLDVYSHILPGFPGAALDAIERALFPGETDDVRALPKGS